MTIWLIGGTSDSVALANLLVKAQLSLIVTVTTPEAQALYPNTPLVKIVIGKMDLEQISFFLEKYQIRAVVDASHPYAVAISQNAIAATINNNISYLRYERPKLPQVTREQVLELDNFSTLLKGDYLLNQRVLLTIGYQNLPLFKSWQAHATLFTRILPHLNSLQGALEAGFTPDRIIAFRPPVNLALERALWQQWQITTVVTKASGKAGGEEIKRVLAQELKIPLIVISRPPITYPQQTSNLESVLSFCRYCLENIN